MSEQSVVWFDEIGLGDIGQVGGKNASLGEMVRALRADEILVPDGFATTAAAYRAFVAANKLEPAIREQFAKYHAGASSLKETGALIRDLFLQGEFSHSIAEKILSSYRELSERSGVNDLAVAVRSSATAEDLPDASFAGQQETFLNVVGEQALLDACRRCYASLFTDRAISYREVKKFDHLEVALSIGVQRMIRSDLGGSGVIFSIDTETGFDQVVVISAAWGLGETVVQGTVEPDKYLVFKPLLREEKWAPIVEKTLGAKATKLIYGSPAAESAGAESAGAESAGAESAGVETVRTVLIDTSEAERSSFVLSDAEIVLLARWAVRVEAHYGRPMDLEWARDGVTGELFLVQARPETVQSQKSVTRFTVSRLTEAATPLFTGVAVGDTIAVGPACVIATPADIENFRDGAILVTHMTDPDWVPIMTRAAGIITDHGGSTSHAAIVSRELGVPAIVGSGVATSTIVDGQMITLSCAEGDRGKVYDGALAFDTEEVDLGQVPPTRTRVMINMASPDTAFRWWRLPAAGVGLARMEFIINNLIQIHPMALVHPERVTDPADQQRILDLTRGHTDPVEFFVQTLARGIAKLAAPHFAKPVIVRLSDFKTNEYAHLIGGTDFERAEENPMLGFRGASRYYDPRYQEGFALECRALKRVREELGFMNVIVMVPFCRTPAEADRVLEVMARNGLVRGVHGLKVYMMCEIPSNVILADEFATRFDGFSIGSNDLTQLVLGVDRDSEELAALFDERDEAVKWMISEAIRVAHESGIPIGLCGQGPSDHADFASFLVREGIDSISLNPDSFFTTVRAIAEAERVLDRLDVWADGRRPDRPDRVHADGAKAHADGARAHADGARPPVVPGAAPVRPGRADTD